jgi:hypothetical protein
MDEFEVMNLLVNQFQYRACFTANDRLATLAPTLAPTLAIAKLPSLKFLAYDRGG